MALAAIPYKYKITAKQVDAGGTGWFLTVQVLSNTNVLLTTVVIDVGQSQSALEIKDAVQDQVYQKMVADAGGLSAALDAVIAGSGVIP